jgi:hypothetical protein
MCQTCLQFQKFILKITGPARGIKGWYSQGSERGQGVQAQRPPGDQMGPVLPMIIMINYVIYLNTRRHSLAISVSQA